MSLSKSQPLPSQNFQAQLRAHILRRLTADYSNDGENSQTHVTTGRIFFKDNRLYSHNIVRVNYTTYDVRRDQDTINGASARCNVMVTDNCADAHSSTSVPYRYAKVLGTYHVNVVFLNNERVDYTPIRVEFLWVRWYEQVDVGRTGWAAQKLDRLRFPPMADEAAFGFLDPSDILRGCHLIPVFAKGRRHIMGQKGVSFHAKDSLDWQEYYIGR